jgi:DNA-binding transcriptional LysR family regulator
LTLAPHAQAMAAAAATLVRAAAGAAEDMSGVVRVTASDIIGAEVLPPILTEFRETWPKIDIELLLSNRREDLLRRDADIAVRMVRPTQDALLARRIGELNLIFHGHRSYLQKHGEPRTMADLIGHTLIGYDRVFPEIEGIADLPFEVTREMFALRTDSDLAQIALLRAGAGLAPCQRAIAAREPNLVPILVGQFKLSLEMWVVMHEDLKADRRLRALFDHLVTGLKAYVEADNARPA